MQALDTATKKPRTRRPSFTAAQIIDALTKTRGMVYLAAKALDCDPSTIHRRAKSNKQIGAAIEASRGELLDVAEVALEAAIQRQEAWAIAFALKTIGRNRGYVEKTEQALSGETTTTIKVEYAVTDGNSQAAAPTPAAGPIHQLAGQAQDHPGG
jgi:hypothetical protein